MAKESFLHRNIKKEILAEAQKGGRHREIVPDYVVLVFIINSKFKRV